MLWRRQCRRDGFRRRQIDIGDGNSRSRFRQMGGDRLADPRAGPGHEGHLAVQACTQWHCRSPCAAESLSRILPNGTLELRSSIAVALVILRSCNRSADWWKGPARCPTGERGRNALANRLLRPSLLPRKSSRVHRPFRQHRHLLLEGWKLPSFLQRFEPAWNSLQRFLAHGDRIMAALHLRTFSPRVERIVGGNGWFWLILLAIVPFIYVGFGMTVDVNGWGWPGNRLPWVDNDYWWHLTAGDYMIDERAMPSPDLWLYTYDGKFVAHEWLGEVFLSVTDRIGGYQAGIVATVLIAALGFWVLIAAMHRYGLSYRACTLATVLWMGVFLRPGVFAVRPQMWAFSFYALFFLFIALYETGRWRTLWILPPFFLIWWNLHLSAVFGILAFGLFGLDQIIRRKPVKHLIIVGVLSLAGVVVNPFGFDYVEQILRFGGRPAIWNERIFEWLPPDFSRAVQPGSGPGDPDGRARGLADPARQALARRRHHLFPLSGAGRRCASPVSTCSS